MNYRVILSILCCLFSLAAANEYLFQDSVNYDCGNYPRGMVFSDLDNDGNLDLVVTKDVKDWISVFYNKGDGTFEPVGGIKTVGYPRVVVASDFNKDGLMDLAVIVDGYDNSSYLSVQINQGNRVFQRIYNFKIVYDAWSLDCADFNDDGNDDLAITSRDKSSVAIYLGNGDGTFIANREYSTGTTPVDIKCTDLNNDNIIDLVVANWNDDSISVFLGKGSARFYNAVPYKTGRSGTVYCSDFNGDGYKDIAAGDKYAGSVSILINNGDGTFKGKVAYAAGWTPRSIYCNDFNGDGNNDVAVVNWNSFNLSILYNCGDGTFQRHINYSVGRYPIAVTGGDLDNDGDIDLAIANTATDNVTVYMNYLDKLKEVTFDIKPGSCSNPINTKGVDKNGKAVVPAAILGSAEFDVSQIDLSSIKLAGIKPIRWGYEDVASPVLVEEECQCSDITPDGNMDLSLKFSRDILTGAINSLPVESNYVLALSGKLKDGSPITGWDCITLRPKGDINGDNSVNIVDASSLINHIVQGTLPVDLNSIGDANCDGSCNIVDASYIINYIFFSGPAPCE